LKQKGATVKVDVTREYTEAKAMRLPALPSVALAWPFLVLVGFFAVPFVLLIRTSFANHDPSAYQGSGLTLSAYAGLAQPMVVDAIVFSIALAMTVATISTVVALPATYIISRMRRKLQVTWLIGLLSTLALSEVLITFAWQIMLSKRVGISNLFVLLGVMEQPVSLAPSYLGVVACIVYVVIPFSILTIYPGMSRLDPSLVEAARMSGAPPTRAFLEVVVPVLRKPIASAFLMTVILTLGAYVTPLVLGGPSNWTIGVIISETALSGQNLPMAAAISVFLLVVTGALIGLIGLVGREPRS
jgi:putative spermidine/putrescine transport system permease protein